MELGPTKLLAGGLWGNGEFVGAPVSGSVGSLFGPRDPIWTPNGFTSDFHTGVDIAASYGTPILCPAEGVVAASYKDTAGGQTVVVRFADGTGAMFIHMEGLQLPQGMSVRRGDFIGTIGTSGLSTGPHLHFSLLKQVSDGPTWYARDAFLDPMLADYREIFTPEPVPVVTAKDYAILIRSYVDQGVPLPAFASMMDQLIGMME